MPDFSFLKEYFDVAIAINIVVLLTAIVQITNTRFSKKYIGLKSFLVFILLALGAVEASTLFSFGLKGQEKSGIFYIIAAVLFSLFLTYGIIILRRVFREPGLNDKKRKRYTITFSLLFIVTALVPIFLDLLSITPYTNTLIVIAVIIEILTIGGYWAYRTKIKTVSNILRLSIIVIMLFNTFTIILLYFGFFDITKIALGVDSYLNLKLLLVVIKFILTLAFSLFIGIDFYRNKYKKHGLHGPTVVNITFYIIIVLAIMAFCFEVVYFTSNTEETLYKGIDTQNDLISNTLDPHDIQKLTGTVADLNLSEYQDLYSVMQKYVDTSDGLTYLYLYGLDETGKVINYVEVKSILSSDTLQPFAPGDVYTEPSDNMLKVFTDKISTFKGPLKDSWGVWYSEFDPVVLPNGKTFILGADISAEFWLKAIFVQRADIVAIMLLVFILLIVAYDVGLGFSEALTSLELSQKKFKNIFDHSSDAILLFDGNKIIDANKMSIRLFGYSLSEIKRFSFIELSTDTQETGEKSSVLYNTFLNDINKEEGVQFEWRFNARRAPIIGSVSLNNFFLLNKRYVLALVRDISGQKKIEKERAKHIEELERLNKIMVGRELKMIELKNKIKDEELQK